MPTTMTMHERETFLADRHVGVISIAREKRGPLTVPIWYDYEPAGELRVITPIDAIKTRLIERRGRFSLCAQNEALPYQYVSVEGPVTSIQPEDREAEGRSMARRYLGAQDGDRYVESTADVRCYTVRMRPEQWFTADYSKEGSGA